MRLSLFASLWTFCALVTLGQEFRATVTGRVNDASGAAVPNVAVQLLSLGTQLPARSFRLLPWLRQRAPDGLLHHPPMHAQLLSHPAIVPTPNSYSRRICSNNSTL